jgi:ATP synthase protein I
MALAHGYETEESEDQVYKPWSVEQVRALRKNNPAVSPGWVIGLQCLAGLLVSLLAWGVAGKAEAAWSAGYGAIAVIIPAALFARGLMSRFSSLNAATASFGFFLWEAVKLAVTVVMIALAPRLIADLSWLALMAGLVVTLKMYWLALLMRPRPGTDLKA